MKMEGKVYSKITFLIDVVDRSPHMKPTKMILQLTLRSTKGHLGYKFCDDAITWYPRFSNSESHDQKTYVQAA